MDRCDCETIKGAQRDPGWRCTIRHFSLCTCGCRRLSADAFRRSRRSIVIDTFNESEEPPIAARNRRARRHMDAELFMIEEAYRPR
jgi:hypothetical protein